MWLLAGSFASNRKATFQMHFCNWRAFQFGTVCTSTIRVLYCTVHSQISNFSRATQSLEIIQRWETSVVISKSHYGQKMVSFSLFSDCRHETIHDFQQRGRFIHPRVTENVPFVFVHTFKQCVLRERTIREWPL